MADRASSVLAALGSQRMSTQRLERPPGTRPRTAVEERSAIDSLLTTKAIEKVKGLGFMSQ
jgi:hypothetical protein